jgi:hypothetical protein
MMDARPAGEKRHLTLDSISETLQECGGRGPAASTFSSFTVASLDVPLGARWTVNQVCNSHADATQASLSRAAGHGFQFVRLRRTG